MATQLPGEAVCIGRLPSAPIFLLPKRLLSSNLGSSAFPPGHRIGFCDRLGRAVRFTRLQLGSQHAQPRAFHLSAASRRHQRRAPLLVGPQCRPRCGACVERRREAAHFATDPGCPLGLIRVDGANFRVSTIRRLGCGTLMRSVSVISA